MTPSSPARARRTHLLLASGVLAFVLLMAIGASLEQSRNNRADADFALSENPELRRTADPLISSGITTKRLTQPTSSSLSTGATTPTVTVTLFGTLPCPTCKAFEQALLSVLEKDPSRLKFSWKDATFSVGGASAFFGARAQRCANDQGKFGPYHRALLEHSRFEISELTTIAGTVGLDTKQFALCMNDSSHDAAIETDSDEARELELAGTPTVFVGSKKYSPPLDIEGIINDIRGALSKK